MTKLNHYEMQADGTLKLIWTEVVDNTPRPDYRSLRFRDAVDQRQAEIDRARFEALADAACEADL